MNEDRFRELGARYLLEGLLPAELAELEAELERRGAGARRELEGLRETLGDLALDADPIEPPVALRARVLGAVEEGTAPGPARPGAPAAEPSGALPLRPRTPRGWVWAGAIAASVALVLGAWNLRLRGDLERAAVELAAARQRLAAADSVAGLVASLRDDLMTLAAPEGRTVSLSGTETEPEARARVFLDPSTGRAILFAYELPVLGPGLVYQLWAIRDGSPASAGVFRVGGDSRGRLEVDPGTLEGAEVLAVTVEPAPGRPAPSGEVVLAGSI